MSALSAEINREIDEQSAKLNLLRAEVGKIIVGQNYLIERLLVGLLADGHVLIEGVPGLAKTTAVKAMADVVQTQFSRIQFTPDLLPADLLGTEIYRPQTGDFTIKQGPIFANLILADEINRSPAKVQSALLEAMQEKQVTIGEQTFKLPEPFLVLATQNPIEQEGTYPLPEAQVDRFMLKLRVGYPNKEEEKQIMQRMTSTEELTINPVLNQESILEARKVVDAVYLDPKVENYIVDIVFATREPHLYKLEALEKLIEFGVSPRASINLAKAAKAYAMLSGRSYVTPQDIKTIGPDVLRHRLLLSYEAEAQELSADDLVSEIFNTVDVP
ncbi:MAG: MoxR family ATPase [Myxococcota bacterium]|jgi:MoxR-like ATPase|nr:MoxR family ATPase [Myxococcota bacterium]